MLLRETDDGILAITQPMHAWLSGILVHHWGNAAFAAPDPRQDVHLAAALHDIGWLDRDRHPRFDARTGLPQVFADVPATEHTALWRTGVEHASVISRYAGVLVSMHGDTIYTKTFDAATAHPDAAAAVAEFLADQQRFREREIAASRANPDLAAMTRNGKLAFDKALLAAVDTMSLHLCWGIGDPVAIRDVPTTFFERTEVTLAALSPGSVVVDPWPFDANMVHFRIEGRTVPRRARSEEDFAVMMDASRLVGWTVVLRPRGS